MTVIQVFVASLLGVTLILAVALVILARKQ
jgi:hypothetical protein